MVLIRDSRFASVRASRSWLGIASLFFLLASRGVAEAQTCPFSPYVDCGNGTCCPGADTCCSTDTKGCCKPGSVCGASGCTLSAGTCPSGYPVDCNDGTCCPSGTSCGSGQCVTGGSGSSGTGSGTSATCPNGLTCAGGNICCPDNGCYPAGTTCCPNGQGCNTAAGEQCCGSSCVGQGMLCCNQDPPQGCVASIQFCCGGACCEDGNSCDNGTCTPPPPHKKSGCSTSPAPDASGSLLLLFGAFAVTLGHRRATRKRSAPLR